MLQTFSFAVVSDTLSKLFSSICPSPPPPPACFLFPQHTNQNAYDCITALDISLRHAPSMSLTCVGRSFFTPDRPSPISGGAEVWLGYYQSLRATQAGLTLNVDMSAMAFVRSMPMVRARQENESVSTRIIISVLHLSLAFPIAVGETVNRGWRLRSPVCCF